MCLNPEACGCAARLPPPGGGRRAAGVCGGRPLGGRGGGRQDAAEGPFFLQVGATGCKAAKVPQIQIPSLARLAEARKANCTAVQVRVEVSGKTEGLGMGIRGSS